MGPEPSCAVQAQRRRRQELAAELQELQARHAALTAARRGAAAGERAQAADAAGPAQPLGAGALADGALQLRAAVMSPREDARRRPEAGAAQVAVIA